MTTIHLSATELKNETSAILNKVSYGESIAIVERYGKPVAKIIPVTDSTPTKKNFKTILDKYYGSIPDFPDLNTTKRHFRRRKVSLA